MSNTANVGYGTKPQAATESPIAATNTTTERQKTPPTDSKMRFTFI